MKIRISLLCLAIISVVMITGACGCSQNSKGQYQSASVNEVLKQGMAEADNQKAANSGLPAEDITQSQEDSTGQITESPESSPEPDTASESADRGDETDSDLSALSDTGEIDIDLTVLSSTMLYSEVYNMVTSPGNYMGKTVKMKAPFACFYEESTGNYYFACIFQDGTACCAQGIEFVLTDEYVYPDDYPEEGEDISVIGVFDTYQEGNYTYCTLRNAKLA